MKKLLIATAVIASVLSMPAMADGRHHGHRGGYQGHGGNWVAPLVGGAIIGGIIANQYYRPAPPPVVYVEPQPRYYAPQTYCRPIEVIDRDTGYRYMTQECWQQ